MISASGWEALPDFREWLGGLPGYPGVVERSSRMSVSGREAIPDVREWSGGHPGCPKVVGKPSRVVGRPSRMS